MHAFGSRWNKRTVYFIKILHFTCNYFPSYIINSCLFTFLSYKKIKRDIAIFMKYIPSSPHFFKKIKISFIFMVIFLILYSLLFPERIKDMANTSVPPNPAKAPWLLLWIQELVSYNVWLIYVVFVLLLILFFLPYICPKPIEKAKWFAKDQRLLNILIFVILFAILILTLLGVLRGENWQIKGFKL